MGDKVIPNIGYREYYTKEVVRIKNPKQQKLYIKHGVFPVDIYVSQEYSTGEEIVVMIFMKDESQEVYEKWSKRELA